MEKLMKHGWIAGLVIVLLGGYGWVMNIVTLCNSEFEPITGMLVARIVGIFIAPLGIVLGYI
jgi:hypothetical protein